MEHELRHWMRLCVYFGIHLPTPKQEFAATRNTLTLPTKSRTAKFRLLQPQHCYLCLLALTVCALYVHGLHYCGSLPTLMLTWVASIILFSLQMLTNLLILMETVCRHRQHAAFLQQLERIEVALKLRLRLNVLKSALLHDLRCLSGYCVVCSLVALLLFMINTLWLNYIGFFLHGLWSILTMRVRIIQLLLYVRILQHYLECLYVKLQQIVAYRLAPQQQLLDIDYVKLASLELLLAIKEIYMLIYGAFYLLNVCAGWSLFGIVSCYMFEVCCNIYWTLLSLDGWSNRRYYYVAGPLVLLPLLAIVCYLCFLCGRCKELAHRIAFLLNKLKVIRSTQSLTHISYRQVLQQLSAQIQLQQIEIFTVTSTNFVILMQFLLLEMELAGLT